MKKIYAVPLCAALLVACGEENTTEVNERTGLQVVAAGDKVDPCTKDNDGEVIFVSDSAAVYYCTDGEWARLSGRDGAAGEKGDAGEKGEKGETGASGKVTNGTSCTAEKKEDGSIEVSCGGEVIGTLTNGTGAEGKSAYDVAKANGFTGTEAEWTASLRGEGCSAKARNDGSSRIDVICSGVDAGYIEDGWSAYEMAEIYVYRWEDETPSDWLEKLKGESCTIGDTTDEVNNKTGVKVTCNGETKAAWNGAAGNAGASCTMDDGKGDGVVEVTCGEGEAAKTVKLYKAMCGAKSYDPAKKLCIDDVLYGLCGDQPYELDKSYCLTLKNDNDELVFLVEDLLIDDRNKADVQTYKTVTIGTQVWMAENLKYNTNTESETNSWCGGKVEGKPDGDCSVYGRLYTWAAAVSACPDGWKLPSKNDIYTLFDNVGGDGYAGEVLKSTSGWDGDGNGIDKYGFSALPAGSTLAISGATGSIAYFWTSTGFTVGNEDSAFRLSLSNQSKEANLDKDGKSKDFSVRCIKNKTVEASN